jgi:class 3 adenylate cyclase
MVVHVVEQWTNTKTNCVVDTIFYKLMAVGLKLNKQKLTLFIDAVKPYYKDLPYHNFRHVYHVALTSIHMLKVYKSRHIDGELFCPIMYTAFKDYVFIIVFAAFCHDLGHNGIPNDPNNRASLELGSNDFDYEHQFIVSESSTNENIHATLALTLFDKHAYCIHSLNKNNDEYNKRLLHNMIIATDIGIHSTIHENISQKVTQCSNKHITSPIHFAMLILKCADVGHFVCKPSTHMYWAFKLREEQLLVRGESSMKSVGTSHSGSSFANEHTNFEMSTFSTETLSFAHLFVYPLFKTFNDSIGIPYSMGAMCWNMYSDQRNYIDELSLNQEIVDMKESITEEHKSVCICMIDIVNFTQWCGEDTPRHVFHIMSKYNALVLDLLNQYDDIEKIEMVGDSMMILGGLRNVHPKKETMENMLLFARKLINNIPCIQIIFRDPRISLRIGIHVGDILIGVVTEPTRIQVYGNSICIASRLEQSSSPGAIMVSESFLDNIVIPDNMTISKPVMIRFKGVEKPMKCVEIIVLPYQKNCVEDLNNAEIKRIKALIVTRAHNWVTPKSSSVSVSHRTPGRIRNF